MTVKQYKSLTPLKFKPEIEFAMQYLEDRGGEIGISFGYLNAIPKAAEILCLELALAEGYGPGV